MSKNYMPEIAKMLGVEVNEEFDIIFGSGYLVCYSPYKITNESMVDCDGGNADGCLLGLLNGEYVIRRHPWKPTNDKGYYYITSEGNVSHNEFSKYNTYDLALLKMGNCFPTKELAEEAKLEMIKELEEIKKEVRK